MIDLHNSSAWTRRQFLHRGLVMASAATTIPAFLQRSAFAIAPESDAVSSVAGVPEDRVLVVIQLAGGNDGLNTVVPFADADYHRARPGIAIGERDALRLGARDEVALHPALGDLKALYDDGLLGIVQGAGYPNPNRSHFRSMDIWHTASTDGIGDGWLGRYFDNACNGSPAADAAQGHREGCSGHAGIALGREAPLAMKGRSYQPISFETPEHFRWTGADLHESMGGALERLVEVEDAGHEPGSAAEFLTRTALDARVASDRIRRASDARPLADYPRTSLGRQLAMVASMIRAGLETRVCYVSMGGFGTRAGQGGANGPHANLLRQYAGALKAFSDDLRAQGNDSRVLTMTFSEFGRRVGQNGSNGTDHGTAAPMFLMGPMARQGVLGDHPSLTDLDNGDLKFTVDFRCVYASVLAEWMRADDAKVLGQRFRQANVLR